MIEPAFECEECRRQYEELLTAYLRLRRKVRKMRRAFARIEGALLFRPERHFETIVGECEMHRGKNAVSC